MAIFKGLTARRLYKSFGIKGLRHVNRSWNIEKINKVTYEGESKIFRTDAVKIVKLTIRPITLEVARRHRSVPPSPFWTLTGRPFLSRCRRFGLDLLSGIKPSLFSFNFIFGNRKKSQNAKSGEYGGWQPFCFPPETAGWGQKRETGRCHGEAARSVLAKVRSDVFARFHAVAAKRRSRTRNSQFGLLGQILFATTTAVYMAAPVRNILDTTS
jgi:hypothetical protein